MVAIVVDEEADVKAFANYTPGSAAAAPTQQATQSAPSQTQQAAPAQQTAAPAQGKSTFKQFLIISKFWKILQEYPRHDKLSMPALSPTMKSVKKLYMFLSIFL